MNFVFSVFNTAWKASCAFYNKGDIINIKLIMIVGKAKTDFRKNPEDYAGAQSDLSH